MQRTRVPIVPLALVFGPQAASSQENPDLRAGGSPPRPIPATLALEAPARLPAAELALQATAPTPTPMRYPRHRKPVGQTGVCPKRSAVCLPRPGGADGFLQAEMAKEDGQETGPAETKAPGLSRANKER
jgi:hypothetical protein